MNMHVRRDEKSNRFCGPAALSLLTGYHVDEAVQAIRECRRARRPGKRIVIRGVNIGDMLRVLRGWGFQYNIVHARKDWPKKEIPYRSGVFWKKTLDPTIAQFLRWSRWRTPDQKFLIGTRGHWLVVRGNKIYDNNNPKGVFIRQYNHRRTRVTQAFEVGLKVDNPATW